MLKNPCGDREQATKPNRYCKKSVTTNNSSTDSKF